MGHEKGSPLHGLSVVTVVEVRVINHVPAVKTKGLGFSQTGGSGANQISSGEEETVLLCVTR